MELYFVRHGVSAERPPDGSDDSERPLTEAGIERMRASAKALRRLDVVPDMLFTSPYARARQTAEIIASELRRELWVVDPLAPGCNLLALRTLLAPYPNAQRMMVVGHEPDWSNLIGTLTGGQVEMKKGAVCRVDLAVILPGAGTLVWLLPPRALREIGER